MKKLFLILIPFAVYAQDTPVVTSAIRVLPDAATLADDKASTEIVESTFVTPKFTEIDAIPVTSISPDQKVSDALLRKGCTQIFTENMNSILTQFSTIASEKDRKTFKQFMLATKLHSDLGFKLRTFEKNTITDVIAVLRTPITKYSACRTRVESNLGYNMITPGPTKKVLLPCETTYAKHVQVVVDTFRGQVDEETLQQYRDFMITLKYFEDLVFQITEFEKRAKNDYEGLNLTLNKLRLPTRQYDTCRDAIIRRKMQQRYLKS